MKIHKNREEHKNFTQITTKIAVDFKGKAAFRKFSNSQAKIGNGKIGKCERKMKPKGEITTLST